jgi:hypothetical protein
MGSLEVMAESSTFTAKRVKPAHFRVPELAWRAGNYTSRKFYNLLKLKEFFEAVGYCLTHGIMECWNVVSEDRFFVTF